MAVNNNIYNHRVPFTTHSIYTVNFSGNSILTFVTHTPSLVTDWITEINISCHLRKTTVGFDIEWRPMLTSVEYYPVATLQICVGHRCLIFQILHSASIPESLVEFLYNPSYTFVGVGIKRDIEKIEDDYGFGIGGEIVDLAQLAADRLGDEQLRSAGLKTLTNRVLGWELVKPREITLSRWDNEVLDEFQVQYACIDAFLSFEIGRVLNA
ncbi:Werner Syndrome-like exonuclease [Impatiens glandulifera]|uniref:Werner Syndrome-like exonuclease n=1 Tax=Impatiens glandulifera TaxID=253017 RepID=UPI001FB15CEB|nr:Werner Syndrome-like exonuclease [Impatiens glandulifera]